MQFVMPHWTRTKRKQRKKNGIQMNIELDLVKDFITNLNYSLDLQESF